MSITLSTIKESYLQLKRHLYYERLDLEARHRIVQFEYDKDFDIDGRLRTINSWINKYSKQDNGVGSPIESLLNEIDLNLFVKKVSNEDDINTSNFITDRIHTNNFSLKKENAFISIPIELQILGTLWLNLIGSSIDDNLITHCYGNRLIKKGSGQDLELNGRLFKIYHFQYARWWKTGLAKAKSILRKDKEDVVMLNFDLKSFYHSICIDKEQLRITVNYTNLSDKKKYLHRVVEDVLKYYNDKLKEYHLNINKEGWALPIGYIASPVLANEYLDRFDKDIVENVRPSYYGRYVDDVLVVFKSGTPKDKTIRNKDQELTPELDKLDENDQSREAVYRFIKYMGDRFNISTKDKVSKIEIRGIKGVELQLEKLFVYELDKKSPSNLIESFIQDQQSKSYEFQFESEENDNVSKDFGNLLFTQSFDKEEASKAKIKRITQNKFEISVFLSRLIRRSTSSNDYLHKAQLENVISFYKGANCIEYWTLWEKIILATVVNNDFKLFLKFIGACRDSIWKLSSNMEDNFLEKISFKSRFKKSMEMILELAISNSIAANPKFLNEDNVRRSLDKYSIDVKWNSIRKAGFVRNEFTAFPLIGLVEEAIASEVSFFSRDEISDFIENNALNFSQHFLNYSPLRVKYWQVCHIEWLNQIQKMDLKSGEGVNYTELEDELNFQKIQLPAFEKYYGINYNSRVEAHKIRKEFFFKVGEENLDNNLRKEELYVLAAETKERLRFGLVNEQVEKENFYLASKGRLPKKGRLETCYRILDEIQRKRCDVAVQPELSVPFDYIWNYCAYSERHQIALVSGVEHKRIRDVVFNFVMTILPMKIDGIYNDAIPVMRLKNHYSPAEEEMIHGVRATVPRPLFKNYHLFHWSGLYFSNYYCYELANIKHRHIFQGEIDVLVAPVWNPDTNYYNGIVETSAREIHCVFSQVNTSKFGDTRWTLPAKTENKNPLKVKGGTTYDQPFTIALSDFVPNKLREFQNLAYIAQKKDGSFKPTPPDYPKEKAVKRLQQRSFHITE